MNACLNHRYRPTNNKTCAKLNSKTKTRSYLPRRLFQVLVSGTCRTNPRIWQFGNVHFKAYCQTSNISRALTRNIIVNNSDVVGASPVGAAPTTSSLSTSHLSSIVWAKTTAIWRFICVRNVTFMPRHN